MYPYLRKLPKVDMLTIQKLYGLNITPMSKAIWEYKTELPSLHELARSLSEKGTDFQLTCVQGIHTTHMAIKSRIYRAEQNQPL